MNKNCVINFYRKHPFFVQDSLKLNCKLLGTTFQTFCFICSLKYWTFFSKYETLLAGVQRALSRRTTVTHACQIIVLVWNWYECHDIRCRYNYPLFNPLAIGNIKMAAVRLSELGTTLVSLYVGSWEVAW